MVEAAGGSSAFFSLVEAVAGLGEANALDCAHAGSEMSRSAAIANASRFISWRVSLVVPIERTVYIDKDATGSAGVNLEIAVTQTVSLR